MNHRIARFLLAAGLALPLLAPAASVTTATDSTAGVRAQEMNYRHDHHGHRSEGHHGRHGHHGHHRDGKPFFLRGITLSAEQDGKLQALIKEQQPALQAKKEAAHKARLELQQLTLSGKFDEKQAKRLADASATARAEIDLAKARHHARILQLLTPEQRQQVEKNLQESAARRDAKQSAAPDAR